MKHESIVVVYDSCQAIAEEIADKLGAETISVQSMNVRQIENCQSFVLAVDQTFCGTSLNGKNMAVFVALGNKHENAIQFKAFCSELKKRKAHLVGTLPYAGSPEWNLNNWVCTISPNL